MEHGVRPELSGDGGAGTRGLAHGAADLLQSGYAGGGETPLQASARSLLLVSAILLVLYGVGIRIDIDPRQAQALGPLVLLRPWFLEVIAWGVFFLLWYRYWSCARPRGSIGRELQAQRFSMSEAAWELVTRQCVQHNVFPESRQLTLASVVSNQRQLESLARSYLDVPGSSTGRGALRERGEYIELAFADLQVEYRNFDASRSHVQALGPIAVQVDRAAFDAAMSQAGKAAALRGFAWLRCRFPLIVAFAMLGVLLARLLTLPAFSW